MKKNILLIGLLAFAVSCMAQNPQNNNKMNTERLTYFSFDHHNTMMLFGGENYHVSTMKDGRIHVVIDESFPEEKEFYINDTAIFDELLAIVKQFNMDDYKGNYQPEMQIFDGDSWSLYYKYDSGRINSSGGYMAWPDNYREARRAINDYFQKWRDYQFGLKEIDFFKFTCQNNQGYDIEYTLQRGENEATMFLRDSDHSFEDSILVSNEYLAELQQLTNVIRLKDEIYDYHTSDENATRCTYFVRYNTGDTVSGSTYYTSYQGQKESSIIHFFSRWLPVQGNLVKFEFNWRAGYNEISYLIMREGEAFRLYYHGKRNARAQYDIAPEVMPELQELVESFGLDNAKDEPKGFEEWTILAFYDSKDTLSVGGLDRERGESILKALQEFFAPYMK